MEKLEAECKKKMDEIKVLIETNKNEEDKIRGTLSSLIRQQFNEKIDEYDKMMKEKNKEKEDQEVFKKYYVEPTKRRIENTR